MSSKTSIIVLSQATPDQNYQLNPPMGGVLGITVQNLSLAGMATTGTSLVLASSNFATNHPDRVSQYNVGTDIFPVPIGWVQPYPLPTRTNQLPPIDIRFDEPRDFNSLFLQLRSNGTATFVGLAAEWLLTFHFS